MSSPAVIGSQHTSDTATYLIVSFSPSPSLLTLSFLGDFIFLAEPNEPNGPEAA